eukprot:4888032-Pyramimonas_sp.AAC.1
MSRCKQQALRSQTASEPESTDTGNPTAKRRTRLAENLSSNDVSTKKRQKRWRAHADQLLEE